MVVLWDYSCVVIFGVGRVVCFAIGLFDSTVMVLLGR